LSLYLSNLHPKESLANTEDPVHPLLSLPQVMRSFLPYLTQTSCFYVVNKAADSVLSRDKGTSLNPTDALPNILVKVWEGFQRELWPDSCLRLNLLLHLIVREGEHAAIGMVDKNDFLGP